jgi:hypothetical protein
MWYFWKKATKNISTNQYFKKNSSQLAPTIFTLVNTTWAGTLCKHKILLAKAFRSFNIRCHAVYGVRFFPLNPGCYSYLASSCKILITRSGFAEGRKNLLFFTEQTIHKRGHCIGHWCQHITRTRCAGCATHSTAYQRGNNRVHDVGNRRQQVSCACSTSDTTEQWRNDRRHNVGHWCQHVTCNSTASYATEQWINDVGNWCQQATCTATDSYTTQQGINNVSHRCEQTACAATTA